MGLRLLSMVVLLSMVSGGLFGVNKNIGADSVLNKRTKEPRQSRKVPCYLSLTGACGSVLKTNDFVSGAKSIPVYGAETIKFGFVSPGDTWDQIAYGYPYYGIGIYTAQFGRPHDLGNPVSIFLLQGATIMQFAPRLMWNYELNLGVSTNWVPYDPFTNPKNEAIGSTINAHVGVSMYLKWIMSKRFDINFGVGLNHFSNGTTHQPNSGINTASIYIELVQNFNRDRVKRRVNTSLTAAPFNRHFEHDVQVILSSKNCEIDTVGTGLTNVYNDKRYNVYGLSYYTSVVSSYKYKYGVGMDFLYDESSNVKMYKKYNPIDHKIYDVTKLGSFGDRISVGVSARGEISLPLYSIFANLGFNVVHGNKADSRFYQIVGVKIYLKDNLFGTFGIRANNFSQAQFLYWSLGYTIKARKNYYKRHN